MLIFDGYDEIGKIINIYNENNLGIYYKIKIIISARKQFVYSFNNYLSMFVKIVGFGLNLLIFI